MPGINKSATERIPWGKCRCAARGFLESIFLSIIRLAIMPTVLAETIAKVIQINLSKLGIS